MSAGLFFQGMNQNNAINYTDKMRRNAVLSIILLLCTLLAGAQQPQTDQRTTETRIADLLMQLPAKDAASLHKIMAELAPLAEPALLTSARGLVTPGKGNDTQFRYAISGLVKYAAEGNDPALKKSCSRTLCQALQTAADDEVKDFLLQELQYVAGEEAVAAVTPLLSHPRLCDPASRVMVRIDTESSGQALLGTLETAAPSQKITLVQALGELRFTPALKTLMGVAGTSDTALKKATLRALAESGDPAVAPLLSAQAAKTGYQFDPANATESWFFLLKRMIEKGKTTEAEKYLKKIVANEELPGQALSGAIALLAEIPGYKIVPLLLRAQKSEDAGYRSAARQLLSERLSPELSKELQKRMLQESDPVRKTEYIRLLAQKEVKEAAPVFLELLSDPHPQVRLAAAEAAVLATPQEAIAPLISLLKKGDAENTPALQEALLTIEGAGLTEAVAGAIPGAPVEAAQALIGIVAKRQDSRFAPVILKEAENSNALIREAATAALSALVKAEDAPTLARLLNQASGKKETSALQEALYKAVSQSGPRESQAETLLPLMKSAGKSTPLYYPVLASIGGSRALAIIQQEMKEGTPDRKEAAVKALSKWQDPAALPLLLQIVREYPAGELRNGALNSYVASTSRSPWPADQKVLLLRQAMELASLPEQKAAILKQIAQNPTLQALTFTSRYLDDPELQQEAIQAIRTIVLAQPGLYGPVVKDIVHQAISLNKDPEAPYQKEALLKHLASLPQEGGFTPMFNGKDLSGWKGLVENPIARSKMKPEKLAAEQLKADERMRRDWRVENGTLIFEGEGYDNLCSEKMYADFELILDWRMEPKGDGGVYLRGTPQVQTWDTSRVEVGAQVGSGGLYNNHVNQSKPLVVADNPINEWNTFRIKMNGDKVTVYLNGQLVTNNVVLENYWDCKLPIFDRESIELQAHGTRLEFRDIYIREIPRPEPYQPAQEEIKEGFVPLFNGIDMTGWTGNKVDYFAQEGMIVCQPSGHGSGNLYTEKEYGDFVFRFEFQLTPGANNGLGIRTPLTGDAAYVGMELQILDNEAEIYRNLKEYQYHGSVYGVIPAKRGFLKPVGEWNTQEVKAIGNHITVTLNGEVILDGDIAKASKNNTATADKREHPGLLNPSGHIGFLGHGSPLKFRNLRIKELSGQ